MTQGANGVLVSGVTLTLVLMLVCSPFPVLVSGTGAGTVVAVMLLVCVPFPEIGPGCLCHLGRFVASWQDALAGNCTTRLLI